MQSQLRGQALRQAAFHGPSARRLVVPVRAEVRREGSFRQIAEQIVRKVQLPSVAKPAALAAITNLLATLPAQAEAGKIFDFNLTLPVMATQFLLLMVFLDKFWFTPVGQVLDNRDKLLREQLGSVKDNSAELEGLQREAEEVIKSARADAAAEIQAAIKEVDAGITAAVDEAKKGLDKELEQALANLEKEQNAALDDVESMVDKLVDEVLNRVLPDGVQLEEASV